MFTRSSLGLSVLPILLAGAALTAVAQTKAPTKEQPVAAKDKAMVEASFAKADANGDGKLSREEAGKLPAIMAKFDELDVNKDGALSLDEFSTAFTASPATSPGK